MRKPTFAPVGLGVLLTVASLALAGCGAGSVASTAVVAPVTIAAGLQGHVHGGQQPVNGAVIQLYRAAVTGYGLAAQPLIGTVVKSDAGGNFSITGTYTCGAADELYLVATGGDPSGSGGTRNNSGLAMMAGLGRCDTISSSTFVSINELTTVATAYALSPFMSSTTQLSTSAANTTGLQNAFLAIPELVNTTSGTLPGPALPSGATFSSALVNTLADVLAVCINSVDSGGNPSALCSNLFAAAKPGSIAPANTIQVALNLAQNPALATSLYSMASSVSPYQPTLTTQPTDWALAIVYGGGAGLRTRRVWPRTAPAISGLRTEPAVSRSLTMPAMHSQALRALRLRD